MKNKKVTFVITVVLLLLPVISGCLDFFQDIPTTYEAHPTKVSYNIKYGYQINCTGDGKYEINYQCNIPESLKTISYGLLYNREYNNTILVNNSFIQWNVSGSDDATYELGITASIESESFLVSDLNGDSALTIQEIENFYPEIVEQYCHEQSKGVTNLIDPNNPNIKTIADTVLRQAETNNSFVIAKLLFTWLKENTNYQMHNGQGEVQPASVTLQKKTGDCDDLSFLYISLSRSIDIPARFVRGYLLQREKNGEVTATAHAWVEVFVGKLMGNEGWVPIECACCTTSIQVDINQNFGVEDAFHLRLFVDEGSNESLYISLSGIQYLYYENRKIELQSFAEIENYLELESKKLVVTKDNTRYYQ